MARKPTWVIDKERGRRAAAAETLWLFGLHAVRDALANPAREVLRLVVTLNAQAKLEDAIAGRGIAVEIADPRKFPVPLDAGSVHQGAAVEVRPLDWGDWRALARGPEGERSVVVLLDRVSDPKSRANGIFANSSHRPRVRSRRPGPSAPSTSATWASRCRAAIVSMVCSASSASPTIQNPSAFNASIASPRLPTRA